MSTGLSWSSACDWPSIIAEPVVSLGQQLQVQGVFLFILEAESKTRLVKVKGKLPGLTSLPTACSEGLMLQSRLAARRLPGTLE